MLQTNDVKFFFCEPRWRLGRAPPTSRFWAKQAAFRFINTHLKNDPRRVLDSEVDLVSATGNTPIHPIDPEKLRAFPADLPQDELNTRIDEYFVPLANPPAPRRGEFEPWRKALREELRRVTFRTLPERLPPARWVGQTAVGTERLETEPGIEIRLRKLAEPESGAAPKRALVVVAERQTEDRVHDWIKLYSTKEDAVYLCEPRGIGETRWTRKNPPNYVERSHALLGRTVDTGRVRDVAATARYLHQKFEGKVPVIAFGQEGAAVLVAYAALWEPDIAAVVLDHPVLSHRDASAPALLNVLRVCDVPEVLGMLAPRPLTIQGSPIQALKKVAEIYSAADAANRLSLPRE